MSLEKILSISGKPGLYQLKNQTRGGFLAESLIDGKKISVSTRHNVSLLSEIAIYTLTEEVPLATVFSKISEKENGGEAINHKSSKDELEEYFFNVLHKRTPALIGGKLPDDGFYYSPVPSM